MKTKEQKQIEAQERQAFHDGHSDKWKLAKALDRGHSNTREFRRIAARLPDHVVDEVVRQYTEEMERRTYGGTL